jgi:hypothetical protein
MDEHRDTCLKTATALANFSVENIMAASLPSGVKNKWDLSTQELHGGQTWMLCGDKYVADFSVTTNGLGTPKSGMDALLASAADISHYPSADCEEALVALGKYVASSAAERLHFFFCIMQSD